MLLRDLRVRRKGKKRGFALKAKPQYVRLALAGLTDRIPHGLMTEVTWEPTLSTGRTPPGLGIESTLTIPERVGMPVWSVLLWLPESSERTRTQ